MRAVTEAERQYLTETQSLTLDEAERDVLVGLTYEESSLLMAYRRRLAAGSTDEDPENLTIWLEFGRTTRMRSTAPNVGTGAAGAGGRARRAGRVARRLVERGPPSLPPGI